MTPNEAADKLGMLARGATGASGAKALETLCEKGCDAAVLCRIAIRLMGPSVITLQPRPERFRGHVPANPRRIGSSLEITGGFAVVPEEGLPFIVAVDSVETVPESSGFVSSMSQRQHPPHTGRPFKTRDLERLANHLSRDATELEELLRGGLARRVLPETGSAVLARTVPGRLAFYAKHVVPALLEKRRGLPAAHPYDAACASVVTTRPGSAEPDPSLSKVRTNLTGQTDAPRPVIEASLDENTGRRSSECASFSERPARKGVRSETVSEPNDEQSRKHQPTISVRSLDTMHEALGTFEMEDLGPFQRRLAKRARRLRQLHSTSAVETIASRFSACLDLPNQLDTLSMKILSAMLKVPVGSKRRPDFAELLWSLFTYVEQQTLGHYDCLVAEFLTGAGFSLSLSELASTERAQSDESTSGESGRQTDYKPGVDEWALRKWRDQHPLCTLTRTRSRGIGFRGTVEAI